ncbi:unnamed protein product, partial [Linum tenue]
LIRALRFSLPPKPFFRIPHKLQNFPSPLSSHSRVSALFSLVASSHLRKWQGTGAAAGATAPAALAAGLLLDCESGTTTMAATTSLAIVIATAAPAETDAPLFLLVCSSATSLSPLGVEDLRIPFQKYGPVKDVYLPKNYYTGEPRGFGFVKFRHGEDAAIAKERLNHKVIGGREIRIVFAEENRKTPQEMSSTGGRTSSRHGGGSRRRSPPRSPRRRFRSSSRSASPPRRDSRSLIERPLLSVSKLTPASAIVCKILLAHSFFGFRGLLLFNDLTG